MQRWPWPWGPGEDEAGCNRGSYVLEWEVLLSTHIEGLGWAVHAAGTAWRTSPEPGSSWLEGLCWSRSAFVPQPPSPADVAEPGHLRGAAAPFRIPAHSSWDKLFLEQEDGGTRA